MEVIVTVIVDGGTVLGEAVLEHLAVNVVVVVLVTSGFDAC